MKNSPNRSMSALANQRAVRALSAAARIKDAPPPRRVSQDAARRRLSELEAKLEQWHAAAATEMGEEDLEVEPLPLSPAQRIKQSQHRLDEVVVTVCHGGDSLQEESVVEVHETGAVGEEVQDEDEDQEDADEEEEEAEEGFACAVSWAGRGLGGWHMKTGDAVALVASTEWEPVLTKLLSTDGAELPGSLEAVDRDAPPLVAALLVMQRVAGSDRVRQTCTVALSHLRRQGAMRFGVRIPELHLTGLSAGDGGSEYTVYELHVTVLLATDGLSADASSAVVQLGRGYTDMILARRYTQFKDLKNALRNSPATKLAFKEADRAVRDFPGKIFFRKFDPDKLAQRQTDLERWLQAVIKDPVLGKCDILGEFLLIPCDVSAIDVAMSSLSGSSRSESESMPLVILRPDTPHRSTRATSLY
eukprot:TRINITY_DN10688_c0_g1_i3.p1 TRINITY_DN10688_c0_g1~~TRINITY_DN10688_c0_g1_i3.p1  ORF type:complete len:418 (-),score=85.49 TRINITY_DN10688_c0_g1_i3:7-1260(-)